MKNIDNTLRSIRGFVAFWLQIGELPISFRWINMFINRNRLRVVVKGLFIYTTWVSIHYFLVHIYVSLCVPIGVRGYFYSMFLIPSPHCKTLIWAISQTSNHIIGLWIFMGTWMLSHLFIQ
uniref:Uncharacterized protein n=1 Tax=viral metagenome TaxID=1070528 RepID=A0A6C0DRS5_9ZZZZ